MPVSRYELSGSERSHECYLARCHSNGWMYRDSNPLQWTTFPKACVENFGPTRIAACPTACTSHISRRVPPGPNSEEFRAATPENYPCDHRFAHQYAWRVNGRGMRKEPSAKQRGFNGDQAGSIRHYEAGRLPTGTQFHTKIRVSAVFPP